MEWSISPDVDILSMMFINYHNKGSSVCFYLAHCLCIRPSEKPSHLTEKAA